jgi:hypothetical protein
MKITTGSINGEDVRVALEAETCAEDYQLVALCEMLTKSNAAWYKWDDMEGSRGIGLIVGKNTILDSDI